MESKRVYFFVAQVESVLGLVRSAFKLTHYFGADMINLGKFSV